MRRFPVDALGSKGARIDLRAEVVHHAVRVLRLQHGVEVLAFDGAGGQAHAVLRITVDAVWLEQLNSVVRAAPTHAAHLVIGLPKAPAADRAVRMGTEAGATHIHLWNSQHAVQRNPKLERLQRIAEEAARQCGRADTPVVAVCAGIQALSPELPEARYLATPGGPKVTSPAQDAAAVVGPEGGFSDSELAQLDRLGFQPMGLGDWILRTETAAALAIAAIQG
jgi:16S rRNA (uracil1498-N3)-methyltransferase